MAVKQKVKQVAGKASQVADAGADTLVDKIKASPYTYAILAGAVVGAFFLGRITGC